MADRWRREADVEDELAFHLAMRIRDYERDGYSRVEAERMARDRFGDVAAIRRALQSHDTMRERRYTRKEMTDRIAQDVRVALRGFRRSPTFAITAVLILGVGIGMTVAIWSVFSAVLLRPPPVSDPDRIVLPRVVDGAGNVLRYEFRDLLRIRQLSHTLSAMTAYAERDAAPWPLTDGERPLPLVGTQVDVQFFDVLGVRPAVGRLLGPSDDSLSRVIVLSNDAWHRYFGGDSSVIGRRFRQPVLNLTYTVVGVAPPGIGLPAGTDYWVPLASRGELQVVARLAPGATLAMTRDEFHNVTELLVREQHWQGNLGAAEVRTFDDAVIGTARPILLALAAAVSLLLAIVCINVGNLQLLRAAARARELAVRRAIGATYLDIVRQLVVENALLGVAGGLLGFAAGELARRVLVAMAPAQVPHLDAVRVSGAPVGFAAVVTLVCVALFGIVPVLVGARRDTASELRLDTRSGMSSRRRRAIRHVLVGAQIASALILLAGAGLLARSLERLQSLDLGFRADHLSVFYVTVPASRYSETQPFFAFWDAIAARIGAMPGVTAMSPTAISPLAGTSALLPVWQAEGQSSEEVAHSPLIPIEVAGPQYFRALGVPILRGRAFSDADRQGSEPVVIVSMTVARRYWPGQDPIGKRVRLVGQDWRTVVGLVGDTRWRTLNDAAAMIYVPFKQFFWSGYVALRSSSSLSALLPDIRRAVRDADPDAVVWSAHTMDDYLDEPLAQPRMSAAVISTFGLVALFLAAIGLYGVMASAVREQTRDIGVRMALGATSSQVRREVLQRAIAVSLGGATVGMLGALATSRAIASLLFEVSPTDPVSLIGACAVLLVVASLAAYLPAYRASRVDPAKALRAE